MKSNKDYIKWSSNRKNKAIREYNARKKKGQQTLGANKKIKK